MVKKKVYLAGKMTTWRDQLPESDVIEWLDPFRRQEYDTPRQHISAFYAAQDLADIADCDALLVNLVPGSSMKGALWETGFAAGLDKLVVIVTSAAFIHPFLAAVTNATFTDFGVAVEFLEEWARGDDLFSAYYKVYEK